MAGGAASPEARAEREALDDLERFTDLIAVDMGPAPGSRQISDREKVRMWGLKDPNVDYDQVKQALMQGGLPPELLDEHSDQALAIVKEHPNIAPMYAQPLDDTMSTYLATLAEYPFRLSALAQYEDDPEGMVREAERMNRLWMKEQAASAQPTSLVGG